MIALLLVIALCPAPASCRWAHDLCLGFAQDTVEDAAAAGRCRGRACKDLYRAAQAACAESYSECLACEAR